MRTLTCAIFLAVAAAPAAADPARVELEVSADCDDEAAELLAELGLDRIHLDLAGPEPPCLAPRLAAALAVALRHPDLEEMARARAHEGCDLRCWLDRPTAAIARVGHRRDQIWPPPPPELAGESDLIFFVCSPDLGTAWLWIAVSRPRGSRIAAAAVSDW